MYTVIDLLRDQGIELGLEKGIEKGRQEGRLEGRLEGRQEGRLEDIEKLLLKASSPPRKSPPSSRSTGPGSRRLPERSPGRNDLELGFSLLRPGEQDNVYRDRPVAGSRH